MGCAFLFFLASIIWYANRSVTISLNGKSRQIRINSSVAQIIDDNNLGSRYRAGNLLAVDDTVLTKGAGERYTVKLNGKTVRASRLGGERLSGGERLTISDGGNTYEPHDVASTDIAPHLSVTGAGPIQYVKTWGKKGRSEVWTGRVSGRTQDRGVVSKAVDCEVIAASVTPENGKKCVALTFNEGPSSHSQEILEILARYGVKATFFLVGETVEENPAAARAIASSGNEIGSNSYRFDRLSKMSGAALRAQISQGFDAIETATGRRTAALRAPYAAFTAQNWAESQDLVAAMVGWSVDSGDWLLQGSKSVTDTVVGSARPGSIIFMTDNASVSAQTAAALPGIIEGLKAQGYEIMTVSDLIATDGELADAIDLAKVAMPRGAATPQVAADQAAQ